MSLLLWLPFFQRARATKVGKDRSILISQEPSSRPYEMVGGLAHALIVVFLLNEATQTDDLGTPLDGLS